MVPSTGVLPPAAMQIDFSNVNGVCNSSTWSQLLAIRNVSKNSVFSFSITPIDSDDDTEPAHDETKCLMETFLSTFPPSGPGRLKMVVMDGSCLSGAVSQPAISSLSLECHNIGDFQTLLSLLSNSKNTLIRLHVLWSHSFEFDPGAMPTLDPLHLLHLRCMAISTMRKAFGIIPYFLSKAQSPKIEEIRVRNMLTMIRMPSLSEAQTCAQDCARLLKDFMRNTNGRIIYEDDLANVLQVALPLQDENVTFETMLKTWTNGKKIVLSESAQNSPTFEVRLFLNKETPLTSTWSEEAHGLRVRYNPNCMIPAVLRADLVELSVDLTFLDADVTTIPTLDNPVINYARLRHLAVHVKCISMASAHSLVYFFNHIRAGELQTLSVKIPSFDPKELERHIDVIAYQILRFPSLREIEVIHAWDVFQDSQDQEEHNDLIRDAFLQLSRACSQGDIALHKEVRHFWQPIHFESVA